MTTTRVPGRRLLHSPGPTPLPDAVLHAMSVQPMDLGDPRVDANINACEDGLRRLFHAADAQIFLYAANGHGVWEAVIENVLAPGETVLVPGTGHFSESWALQAEHLGRHVVRTPWREGWPIEMAAVEQALRDDKAHAIKAVFAIHADTSSGVTNDLAAVRRAIDAAGPAGRGRDIDPRRRAVLDGRRGRRRGRWRVAEGAHVPRGGGVHGREREGLRRVAAQQRAEVLLGLGPAQQGALVPEILRHAQLARAVHAALEGWRGGGAVDFFAQDPATRSVSVTTIKVSPGIDVEAIRDTARDRFQVGLAGGLGTLAGRAFRIGHLGDCNPAMILGAIGGVEAALVALGIPVGDGGTRRAVMSLADTTR